MAESFLSMDPIEQYLCKSVDKMTSWELIAYLKDCLRAFYGITLISRGSPDVAIFTRLKKEYGDTDAGRIVKWVIWQHFARDSANPGDFIQFTSFSKGRDWWVNHMHAEMQKQVARETTPVVQSTATSVWI